MILSGKGGTGKTTVAAALAHLAAEEGPIVLTDADVEAANLELVLQPAVRERHQFVAGETASLDRAACTRCGVCLDVCRFGAIQSDGDRYSIDDLGAPREPLRWCPVLRCGGCARTPGSGRSSMPASPPARRIREGW